MSNPTVEFHFDFGSTNAYFSHLVVPQIAARTGVPVIYKPVLLGGVFKATGNSPPMVAFKGIKNKSEYHQLETTRFLAKHAITNYAPNPHFPVNTLQIMRGAVAAGRLGCFDRYVDEVFRHMWAEPKKMDDPVVVQAALMQSGLPVEALVEAMQDAEVKAELIANTQASVERGVFGSPSFFVGAELFFGKDRLREMEEEIEAQKAAA